MKLGKEYKTVMDDHFPDSMTITFGNQTLFYKKKKWKIEEIDTIIEKGLRYGENPGQEAAMYELINGNLVLGECKFIEPGNSLVSGIDENMMLQPGKHPGKINITDIDNALNILKFLTHQPAAVIIKHNNPCGVAYGSTISDAYNRAFRADRIAAFGGCVAINRPIDRETAELISHHYIEVIVAPDFIEGSFDILKKKKNLRIIKIERIDNLQKYNTMRFIDYKSLMDGGIIVQQSQLNKITGKENLIPAKAEYKDEFYTIDRLPNHKEYEDLLFGWYVEQGVSSNSVIFVKDLVTLSIGTGEQDRVGVVSIAVFKAYTKYADLLSSNKFGLSYTELERDVEKGIRNKSDILYIDNETRENKAGLIGSALISDGFFPFRDGVDIGIKEGATSIIQPGGSDRDFESIIACNEANPKVAMVYTAQRAFKH